MSAALPAHTVNEICAERFAIAKERVDEMHVKLEALQKTVVATQIDVASFKSLVRGVGLAVVFVTPILTALATMAVNHWAR
jgi:hypothetical protein